MAWKRILMGCVVLALLALWADYASPYPALEEILAHPSRYDGKHVEGFSEAVVSRKTDGGFELVSDDASVRVLTKRPVAGVGTYVSVAGMFRAPDFIEAEAIYFAKRRGVKMLVSVTTLVVLLALAPKALRVDRQHRALSLREERDA